MKKSLFAVLCCVFVTSPSSLTYAQSITSGSVTGVPVNNPLMLLLLTALLAASAFVVHQRKRLPAAMTSSVLVLTAAIVLWQAPALKAQIGLSFLSASGETLPIPVDYDVGTQAFVPVDYTNAAGAVLQIRQLVLPTYAQCFSGGLVPLVAPPPAVFDACDVGRILSNGSVCRVDVHDVCADLLALNMTQLSASSDSLALSINSPGADPALVGNPRRVTMTNTGALQADNVQVNLSGLPTGTSVSNNTCVGNLSPGATCDITFTPGGNASLDVANNACTTAPGTEPVPSTLTVTADNALPTEVDVLVLGYGCIYQGGFLFAIDDTTPDTGSVAGKAASLVDQAAPATWATILDDTAADSITNGSANTAALAFPAGQYPQAQACLALNDQGFSDWYLPAVCELGRFVGLGVDTGCGAAEANLYTTLHTNNLGSFTNFFYASSTEEQVTTSWTYDFSTGMQAPVIKFSIAEGRCVRSFSP